MVLQSSKLHFKLLRKHVLLVASSIRAALMQHLKFSNSVLHSRFHRTVNYSKLSLCKSTAKVSTKIAIWTFAQGTPQRWSRKPFVRFMHLVASRCHFLHLYCEANMKVLELMEGVWPVPFQQISCNEANSSLHCFEASEYWECSASFN